MINIKRKYKGFSLVELLLAMMILSVIMLLVATTLNTVIKVSNTTNSKNTARADVNYIIDFVSRALTNSELNDIYMYNSKGVRFLAEAPGGGIRIVSNPLGATYDGGNLGDIELYDYNEIHIKLYGYQDWTCIGYFKQLDNTQYGYLVRTVYEGDLTDSHSSCFDENAVLTPMHSFMVDVSQFNMDYIVVGDGQNRMFIVDTEVEPLLWPVKDTFPITRTVSRQAVIATQALTWY